MNLGQRVEIGAIVVGLYLNGEVRLQLRNGDSLVTHQINLNPENEHAKREKGGKDKEK